MACAQDVSAVADGQLTSTCHNYSDCPGHHQHGMQGPGRYLRAFNGRRGVFRPYGRNHRQSNVPVRLLKLPLEIKAYL
jgi:hypothetical protein